MKKFHFGTIVPLWDPWLECNDRMITTKAITNRQRPSTDELDADWQSIEMFGKPPVTKLQEYCAKQHLDHPVYKCMNADDGTLSFICQVEALDATAEGNGRSKKEARHDAAANLIKRVQQSHPEIEDIPQAEHGEIPTVDAIINLRDICVQQDHPLPNFELIQQAGPPESPEFTVQCTVASITRLATATTKKAAKQIAAQLVINIIQSFDTKEENMQIATIDAATESEEQANRRRFKSYREYIDSDCKDVPGTLLTDRHKYFQNFDPETKANGYKVLASFYISQREQVDDLFKELKLKYKLEAVPSSSSAEGLYFMQLVCDFDACFCGTLDEIFTNVLIYFKDMF